MKKLLILLALAACAACNTEDDNDNRQTATFGGTLTITSNQTPSATPFVTNNISFELTEDNSGLFKLTMYNVRFAQSMPMSLNIVIPELTRKPARDSQSRCSPAGSPTASWR